MVQEAHSLVPAGNTRLVKLADTSTEATDADGVTTGINISAMGYPLVRSSYQMMTVAAVVAPPIAVATPLTWMRSMRLPAAPAVVPNCTAKIGVDPSEADAVGARDVPADAATRFAAMITGVSGNIGAVLAGMVKSLLGYCIDKVLNQ
jgi:hypothetical protein